MHTFFKWGYAIVCALSVLATWLASYNEAHRYWIIIGIAIPLLIVTNLYHTWRVKNRRAHMEHMIRLLELTEVTKRENIKPGGTIEKLKSQSRIS